MDEHKNFTFNGVEITAYKLWAYNLMKREAAGENLNIVSADAWREVLGFSKSDTAKQAIKSISKTI